MKPRPPVLRVVLFFSLAALVTPGLAGAGTPPAGWCVPKETLSPDGAYGVLAPGWKLFEEGNPPHNQLVSTKTGAVLLTIGGPDWATWIQDDSDRTVNHLDLEAVWSKDGATLAWVVGGKWSPAACELIRVRAGKVAWHLDVLAAAQKEMLAATRAAAPKNYAAARKQNEGSGDAFPEGFTIGIDVPTAGFTLPWKGRATLDSNPKGIGADRWPSAANVGAAMDFVVDVDGKITFSNFEIDPEQTGVPRE
jgi:hypothetical protein